MIKNLRLKLIAFLQKNSLIRKISLIPKITALIYPKESILIEFVSGLFTNKNHRKLRISTTSFRGQRVCEEYNFLVSLFRKNPWHGDVLSYIDRRYAGGMYRFSIAEWDLRYCDFMDKKKTLKFYSEIGNICLEMQQKYFYSRIFHSVGYDYTSYRDNKNFSYQSSFSRPRTYCVFGKWNSWYIKISMIQKFAATFSKERLDSTTYQVEIYQNMREFLREHSHLHWDDDIDSSLDFEFPEILGLLQKESKCKHSDDFLEKSGLVVNTVYNAEVGSFITGVRFSYTLPEYVNLAEEIMRREKEKQPVYA